jgi:deoxyadenosine/deoxycytidine kinase
MIVEFIGSTGAGKSTLIREVQRQLAKTTSVTTSVELAAGMLGLRSVTHPTLQNLIQEVVGFPFFMGALYHYRGFLRHTIRLFLRHSRFSMRTLNNLRSLERKIGMYEIMRRSYKERIILVDEGPILAAHMFASTALIPASEEITQFTDMLPLPDLVVYSRASIDTIMERTLQRADPPREIDVKDPSTTREYVKSAVAIFDQLIQAENIRCRLLVIESPNRTEPGYKDVINRISQSILDRRVE